MLLLVTLLLVSTALASWPTRAQYGEINHRLSTWDVVRTGGTFSEMVGPNGFTPQAAQCARFVCRYYEQWENDNQRWRQGVRCGHMDNDHSADLIFKLGVRRFYLGVSTYSYEHLLQLIACMREEFEAPQPVAAVSVDLPGKDILRHTDAQPVSSE